RSSFRSRPVSDRQSLQTRKPARGRLLNQQRAANTETHRDAFGGAGRIRVERVGDNLSCACRIADATGRGVARLMIKVVDLRKSFIAPNGQRIDVLRGVTFTANGGESIAITGASGSGKSTLLHLLGGLETADHGTIEFNGEIGFVFQFHYLLPDLSALENVALPLLIARWKKERAYERARKFLEETGLGDRAQHPISHLSG